MNIYKSLNEVTQYIDQNLSEEINYDVLSKMLGVNTYTMQRLFTMIAGVSLSEYIRKRRLSSAGYDIYTNNMKVIDNAVKYQYNNATSFSRAFEKFHGIKPSLVTNTTNLKIFPNIIFDENMITLKDVDGNVLQEFEV